MTCKLENQGSQHYPFTESTGPRTNAVNSNSQLEAKDPAAHVSPEALRPDNLQFWCLKAEDVGPAQNEGENIAQLFNSKPSLVWVMPTILVSVEYFLTESTDSNINLFKNFPYKHTPK